MNRNGWVQRGVVLAILCGQSLAAIADETESPYCQKVRGYADGEASLFLWPKIIIEGIRFPTNGRVDLGATVGNGYQARAGMSISPIDIWRGVRTKAVADADCKLQAITEDLRELVVEAANDKTLPALKAQTEYLQTHREEWRKLFAKAQESLRAGAITTVELQDLRRFVGVLERKVEGSIGETEKLETRVAHRPQGSLNDLARKYEQLAMELEGKKVSLRALDPWEFRLRGAATIPGPGEPGNYDWYGLAEIAFSLGGFVHGGHDERALEGRRAELRSARYEIPYRLRELKLIVGDQVTQARHELAVVQSELESVVKTRTSLAKSDVPTVEHARAMLTLEQYSLEADQLFLRTLIDSLSTLGPTFAPAPQPEVTPARTLIKEKERS